ncbi:MAG: thymidine phosphorylase [Verrucomicrobia bacterium]|nr:MAG: thymidine phosphorylase [Verrucomicrobiota bacterium]
MNDASLFPQHIIARKRDGFALTKRDIEHFVRGATEGTWEDYQLTAMLMAIFLRGMDTAETASLTEAMMNSGTVADLSHVPEIKVDKHSTGGVGDKISMPLAAMVAACGVPVPMISGRGLGHTGGTLDKLESIPGFRVGLSLAEYATQVEHIGCALIGQTRDLAPADKKLYALRDVTATVECLPLICASIMSKKMAEGIDALVLDVKFGGGAFMKTLPEARALAQAMCAIGRELGRPTRALLTRMDQPLGRSVGNALEVAESVACLRGEVDPGTDDLMEVTYALGAEMLLLAGVAQTAGAARARLASAVSDGSALAKFRQIVVAQDGDSRVCDTPATVLPRAPVITRVRAQSAGWIHQVNAMAIAQSALRLGAGRIRASDTVDHSVGFERLVKVGEYVSAGALLGVVHSKDETSAAEAANALENSVKIGAEAPALEPLVVERIG